MSPSNLRSLLGVSAFAFLGAVPLASLAQVVKIDGSSTVYPSHRSRGGRVPEGQQGLEGHGRCVRHRWRLQEVLPRRNRHIQRFAPYQCVGNGRLQGCRCRVFRTAGGLRCADGGDQPQERLAQAGHSGRAQEDVGARCPGQDHALEPGQPGLARPAHQAVWRGRRLGYLRLLHRGHCRQVQVQPWRLHRVRRRQRAGAGCGRRCECHRLLSAIAYYAENTGKLKALPIVEKEGKPAVSPSAETVLDGTYQPLARPIFIYVNAKSLAKPEVKKFVDFYMTQGARWPRK
jgi:hypothetical protein